MEVLQGSSAIRENREQCLSTLVSIHVKRSLNDEPFLNGQDEPGIIDFVGEILYCAGQRFLFPEKVGDDSIVVETDSQLLPTSIG